MVNNSFIEVEHTFTIDPSWDVMHCELVYFLQDTDTKEILQGGKVMVNDLIPVGNEEMMAGEHQISWEAGAEVPNGIYFCTISSADHKLTQKVMLSR